MAAARDAAARLEQAVGDVLKQSAAASLGAGAATWDLYADYFDALGFRASSREALLKHVRAPLAATAWLLLLASFMSPCVGMTLRQLLAAGRLHMLIRALHAGNWSQSYPGLQCVMISREMLMH